MISSRSVLLFVPLLVVVSGNKIRDPASVAASHEAGHSWFDKFKVAFGAPKQQIEKAAQTSLQAEPAHIAPEANSKSLMSKLKVAFGAPESRIHDVRVAQTNLFSEAAFTATSWFQRFASGHKDQHSFLELNDAAAPLAKAKATSSGSLAVEGAKVAVKGDYVMGPGLRIFYVVLTVILILITLASCAWLYKETPGSSNLEA
eukprot:TRINITY_DN5918_c0_g1_i1.p1 TRINITY_DN5918_c0_g1~~TRINITY_DN5918_c0_g1_i1.p1  ORF type:complete len:202 (+),score=46.40 TRINITY_DN5918_c0_g1_i1:67-672(+)